MPYSEGADSCCHFATDIGESEPQSSRDQVRGSSEEYQEESLYGLHSKYT